MTQGESQWIMNALNQLDHRLHERLNEVDRRVDGRFDKLDDRLQAVEGRINRLWGGIILVAALLPIVGAVAGAILIAVLRASP